MNKTYRSLYNPARAAWVAVPEIARSRRAGLGCAAAALLLAAAPPAAAQAGSLYWNLSTDPGGQWSAPRWRPAPAGAPQGWTPDSVAVFTSGASGLQLHTLDQNFSAAGLVLTGGELFVDMAGGAVLTLTGAAPSIEVEGALTLRPALAGGAGLVKRGGGLLVLEGVSSYGGGTRVAAGTLRVSQDANLGAPDGGLRLDGGATLQLAASNFQSSRAVALAAGEASLDVNGTHGARLDGAMSGAGGLAIVNSASGDDGGDIARLTLGGEGAYSGGTRIGAAAPGGGRTEVVAARSGALGSGPVDLYLNSQLRFEGSGVSAGGLQITSQASSNTLGTNTGVVFGAGTDAGSARIASAAAGSYLIFEGGSSAGGARIDSGPGGRVYFYDGSSGGDSVTTNRGGLVDIAGTVDMRGARIDNQAGNLFLGGAAGGVAIGSLSGAGNVLLGVNTLTLGGLGRDDSIGGVISDTGGGGLVKIGGGTLRLGGANTYTGATTVRAGTLQAAAPHVFSAASAHAVEAGATLDTAGFDQTLDSLSNAGTVSLAGARAGATLTIAGGYVGQGGVLQLGAALGAGIADRLVLQGGRASGHTTLRILALDGLGAPTAGDGIVLVQALGGATTTAQTTRDAFALGGGHLDAGAYEYRLFAADASGAGENWYLRSEAVMPPTQPPAPPAPPPTPPDDPPPQSERPAAPASPVSQAPGGVPVPLYRAEVPLAAALPAQLRQAETAMLGNLHQRIGDEGGGVFSPPAQAGPTAQADAAPGPRRAWARLIAAAPEIRQNGSVTPASQGDLDGFQLGADLWAQPASPWRAGLYVGQLDGDARVSGFARGVWGPIGAIDLRARFLGLYATFEHPGGFYADAVMQWARHDYTMAPSLNLPASGQASGRQASLEIGQGLGLGGGWRIEPQLQAVYRVLAVDALALGGARVQQQSDSGWLLRAGLRLQGEFATGAGALRPYVRANYYHAARGQDVARFAGPAASTDIVSSVGGDSGELAAGFTLALGPRAAVYGEAGKLWSAGGPSRVASSMQGGIGVKLRW